MLSEREIIILVDQIMPSSSRRHTACFEADAEEVSLDSQRILLTMDEFSEEDMFRDSDGYSLGWNIAAGSLSDIYAVGGEPVCYSHVMRVSRSWDRRYLKEFAQGISDVLSECNVVFSGGDTGISESWSYTASVIGKRCSRVVSRKGACPGDRIYVSGRIGAGNLDAGMKLFSSHPVIKSMSGTLANRLFVRKAASGIVREYGSSCIDTSDGLLQSLNILAELNGIGYEIRNIPYLRKAVMAASILSLPKELLVVGECGEYELLFTVPPDREGPMLESAKAKNLMLYKIGTMHKDTGTRMLIKRRARIDLSAICTKARGFRNIREYFQKLTNQLINAEKGLGKQ